MLGRLAFVCLVATAVPALAGPAVEIHASCAANVVADAEHLATLRRELAQSLAQVAKAHVIDASIVTLDAHATGNELQVQVEVRALVSDPDQHAHWVTTAKATARGGTNERTLLERDAISAAARQIGQTIARR